MYEVWTDGSCKPKKVNKKNRRFGKSSIGVVIKKDGETIFQHGEHIGIYDNNQAEYIAFIYAVKKMLEYKPTEVKFYCDSNVVTHQINKITTAKSESIIPFYNEAKDYLDLLPKWSLTWIPRKQNSEADKLASCPSVLLETI